MEKQIELLKETGSVSLDLTVTNNICTLIRSFKEDRSIDGNMSTVWNKVRTLKKLKIWQAK